GLRLPQLHRTISAGAGEALAVGAKAHAMHSSGVSLEGEDFLPLLPLPHLYRLILAGAGQALAVGAEAQASHGPGVSLEGAEFSASLHVPHLHFYRQRLPLRVQSS